MKTSVITSTSAQTRVANLIVASINNAVSLFSDAPVAKIDSVASGSYYKVIVVENKKSSMLTFAEIDTIRAAADVFCKKYKGMYYTMQTRPYLAQDGSTWLHRPVFEVCVRKYDKDEVK